MDHRHGLIFLLLTVLLSVPYGLALKPLTTWEIKTPPNLASIRFLVLSYGTRGDVQPYVALCKLLQRRGHVCRIATHESYRSWLHSQGVEHRVLGGSGEVIDRFLHSLTQHGIFHPTNLGALPKMARFLGKMYEEAWHAANQGDTDVILGVNWVHIGQHIAERLRIPYIEVQAFPNSPTRDFNLFVFENHLQWLKKLSPSVARWVNRFSYTVSDWTMSTVGQIHLVNSFRRNVLRLPALSSAVVRRRQRSAPIVYGLSPIVLRKPSDYSQHVHFVGYWQLPFVPDHYQPPAELVRFLNEDPGTPIVYLGFGSMQAGRAVQQLVADLLQMMTEQRVSRRFRLIYSHTSPSPFVKNSSAAGNGIYALRESVPHQWLFPRVDVAIHHGGAGTVAAAMLAGVPSIIRPFLGDQFLWCEQIQRLTVGLCIQKEGRFRSFVRRLFRRTSSRGRKRFNDSPLVQALFTVLDQLGRYQHAAHHERDRLLKEQVHVGDRTMAALERELHFILRSQDNFPGTEVHRTKG